MSLDLEALKHQYLDLATSMKPHSLKTPPPLLLNPVVSALKVEPDDDILNIDKFLHEPYSDVALAAEPPFASDYPEIRAECISPTKSIWTPIAEKPVPTVEALSLYPVKTLKDSKSLWSCESEETLYGAVNILEEYEMESNKLRYLSFEKSTKAHYQVGCHSWF